MSINFCTINNSTINAFCSNRRQVVLDRLLDEKYPVVQPARGTNPRVLRDTFQLPREPEELQSQHFEQPFITVSAELFGANGSMQLDSQPRVDFVIAADLKIGAAQNVSSEITVNISDLEI